MPYDDDPRLSMTRVVMDYCLHGDDDIGVSTRTLVDVVAMIDNRDEYSNMRRHNMLHRTSCRMSCFYKRLWFERLRFVRNISSRESEQHDREQTSLWRGHVWHANEICSFFLDTRMTSSVNVTTPRPTDD